MAEAAIRGGCGLFHYRVTLPQNTGAEHISGELAEGVLTVRVPKARRPGPGRNPPCAPPTERQPPAGSEQDGGGMGSPTGRPRAGPARCPCAMTFVEGVGHAASQCLLPARTVRCPRPRRWR
ncbi:Hsp20 family protein [Streptomyces asiaticus]|uniref:Hsp20 family protein n=1 Tax=Streptomyces asiaticus TaxID=114695 RepID=UPI0039BDEBCE